MDATALFSDSPQLQAAQALLASDPLPDDIIEQLEALEDTAPDAEKFGDLWEALLIAHPELNDRL